MGWGDDVIARANAYHQWLNSGLAQRIYIDGRPQAQSLLWQSTPWIDQHQGQRLDQRTNGLRPYAESATMTMRTAPWLLSDQEQELYLKLRLRRYWILVTDVKQNQHIKNKQWPWMSWCELATLIHRDRPDQTVMRIEYTEPRQLPWAQNIRIESLRTFLVWLRAAELVITTEGFAHHVRGQEHLACVTIYASATSPRPSRLKNHAGTGYPDQLNIESQEHQQCYPREHCEQCAEAMQTVTAESVWQQTQRYLLLCKPINNSE